jgi:hypothetical protein
MSALKGQRFCDVTEIIKNATEELKRLSQNGFQECFQHLYCCWQKFVAAQVDCFEGWFYCSLLLRKKEIPGTY